MAAKNSSPMVTATEAAVNPEEKSSSIITEVSVDLEEDERHLTATPANSEKEKESTSVRVWIISDRPPRARRLISEARLPTIPRVRYLLLVLGLVSGLFLSMLDASIIATSLFSIAADMKDLEQINWVALSYGLTYLGFAALFARVSDVIGRRAAVGVAFFIFITFSLGCGFSETIEQLIACRAAQGLGGAGLYSLSMVILPEMTLDEEKKYIGAIVGMVIATSGVMGPVLGGLLTEYVSWRWVFWINGPIGAVALITFLAAWPSKNHLPIYDRRTWKEIDYLGSLLLMSFAVLAVFPFQNLSSHDAVLDSTHTSPYTQPLFFFPLIGAFIALLLLLGWHAFAAHHPTLKSLAFAFPPSLLWSRTYVATIMVTALTGLPYLLAVYAFPVRFQVVHGKSPLEAGLMLLPMLGSSAIGTVTASVVNSGGLTGEKKPRFFETFVVACLVMLIGCAAQTTVGSDDGRITGFEAKDLGLLTLIGFGFGMSAAGATMFVNLESSIGDHASAQGIVAQFRILGGSIGIAVSSAILGERVRSELGSKESFASVVTKIALGQQEKLSSDEMTAIRQVYTMALRKDMMICCGVLVAGVVCSLFVYRRHWLSTQQIMELRYEEEQDRGIGVLDEHVPPFLRGPRDRLVKLRGDIFAGKVRPRSEIVGRKTMLGAGLGV